MNLRGNLTKRITTPEGFRYPSRITDAVPQHVVDALKEMLSL